MILKSSRRGATLRDARELLGHVLSATGNERVVEVTGLGAAADLADDARALAAGSGGAALWHLSASPALELREAQWDRVEEAVRGAYGLGGDFPIVVIEHAKPARPGTRPSPPPRPPHRHFLFPTRDPATGRAIDPWRHYAINERVARQLESEFQHPFTKGRHNRAVALWCAANGLQALAEAMEAGGLLRGPPPVQAVSEGERRAAERRGANPFLAADASAAALDAAASAHAATRGRAFRRECLWEGYELARGGRLVLIPLDGGRPVGAARKARRTEEELRDLLGPEFDRLPTIGPEDDPAEWLARKKAAPGPGGRRVTAEEPGREAAGEPCAGRRGGPDAPGPEGTAPADAPSPPPPAAPRHGASRPRPRHPALLPEHRAIVRSAADGGALSAGDRSAWLASVRERGYDILPSLAARVVGVDVDGGHQAVFVRLASGALLVDRLDRLDLLGASDGISTAEFARIAVRRGWMSAEVRGDAAFRRAVAERLRTVDPSIGSTPLPSARMSPG